MTRRRPVELGAMEQTMLPPLRARALDARRRRPVVPDPVAAELGTEIDTGAAATGRMDDLATVLREAVVDHWVRGFLDEHPAGTVVELGAGLSTRTERLAAAEPGTDAQWVHVDLPDVAALRRELLGDAPRRHLVAGSVLDEDWLDVVRGLPGPYLLVSETVLTLLPEQGVQRVVFTIGRVLPGATLVTDTVDRAAATRLERTEPLRSGSVRFDWTCEDPAELQPWGLRLLEARGVADVPDALRHRLAAGVRARMVAAGMTPRLRGHKLARYEVLAP